MGQPTEGWKWLVNATKWHYFIDNEALCKKWMTFSMNDVEEGNDDSPDNCKACRRALKKRQADANKKETK